MYHLARAEIEHERLGCLCAARLAGDLTRSRSRASASNASVECSTSSRRARARAGDPDLPVCGAVHACAHVVSEQAADSKRCVPEPRRTDKDRGLKWGGVARDRPLEATAMALPPRKVCSYSLPARNARSSFSSLLLLLSRCKPSVLDIAFSVWMYQADRRAWCLDVCVCVHNRPLGSRRQAPAPAPVDLVQYSTNTRCDPILLAGKAKRGEPRSPSRRANAHRGTQRKTAAASRSSTCMPACHVRAAA